MKRTKIICTIGPATETKEQLNALVEAGMNVARLNFSHGSHENHTMLINNIRAVSEKRERPIAIMQDLQGPRIRLGELPQDGIAVKRGDTVMLVYEEHESSAPAHTTLLPTQVDLAEIVKPGEPILIKDGLVQLKVVTVENGVVTAEVEQGDILTSNRGINLPDSNLPDEVITDKDKEDLKFGLKQKVDWIALSFVRDAKDVQRLRALIPESDTYSPNIIAKIERKEAVKNFDEILEEADGIMIARGDLGIELPAEEIPLLQKGFIEKCVHAAKPVVVATQMLESMMINPRPTRAEVSDVANAVIDHTDAVMLSGETSTGSFPIEACSIMAKVLRETEESPYDDMHGSAFDRGAVSNIIAQMTEEVVEHDDIKAIVVMSSSGTSARMIASQRPDVPIVALTQSEVTQRQMCLVWGLEPFFMERHDSLDALINASVALVQKEFAIKKGEKIVVASGHPTGPHGSLNLLKVHTV